MPIYHVTIEGETYVAEIEDLSERPLRVVVDGELFEVEVQSESAPTTPPATPPVSPTPSTKSAPTTAATTGASGEVTAPLPGTIVSIAVAEGDSVEPGQELCVLEAMKMNNPIKSTQSGVVEEIVVNVGQPVQHGTLLMTIAEA
jgi:biotin carboxyl carrier protein